MSNADVHASGPGAAAARGAGLPGDFSTLFAESFRRLWLLACGMVRDRALAEDIVQEAAVIGLEKWSQFTPGTSFSAWMGQMVRFVALNHIRREKRRRTSAVDPATMDATEASSSTDWQASTTDTKYAAHLSLEQHDFDDEVMRALEDVGEVPRACLLLRSLDDLSYAEIAVLLEIPEGTAMSHVHRTRQLLRARLAQTGRLGASATEDAQ